MNIIDIYSRMTSLAKNRRLGSWADAVEIESLFRSHSEIIIENWYMYYGLHNLFLQRFEGEDDQTFAKRVFTSTVENHVKFILNTIASYLYPNPDSLKRYVERDGSTDKNLMKVLQDSVWNHNKFNTIDVGKALNALVTGYTIVQRSLYDVRTDRPFAPISDNTQRAKFGYIKKKLIDSSKAIPLPYMDEFGALHEDRLGAIVFMATTDNYVGVPDLMKLMDKKLTNIEVLEYVDDTYWFKWTRTERNKDWIRVDVNPGTPYVNKNPFGDINALFTVYKNFGDPFQLTGNSEVTDLKSINLEIDELGNADKETIRYHSYPILTAFGGATVLTNFVRTKNAILETDKSKDKADYKYLVWEGNLTESKDRQETMRSVMSSISGVSLITRGFLKDIGQIRSGPPLKALFSSDKTSMNLRFTSFEECEALDMKNDVRFYEKVTGQNFDVDKTVVYKAKFDRDFLGLDELLDALPNSLIGFKPTRLIEFHLSGYTPEQSRAIGLVLKAKMNKAEIIIDSTAKN